LFRNCTRSSRQEADIFDVQYFFSAFFTGTMAPKHSFDLRKFLFNRKHQCSFVETVWNIRVCDSIFKQPFAAATPHRSLIAFNDKCALLRKSRQSFAPTRMRGGHPRRLSGWLQFPN